LDGSSTNITAAIAARTQYKRMSMRVAILPIRKYKIESTIVDKETQIPINFKKEL